MNGIVFVNLVLMVSLWLDICSSEESLVGGEGFGIRPSRQLETNASTGTQDSKVDALASNIQLCNCQWYCQDQCDDSSLTYEDNSRNGCNSNICRSCFGVSKMVRCCQPCQWMTRPWGECSNKCGLGSQTRDVFCGSLPTWGCASSCCQTLPLQPPSSQQCVDYSDCPSTSPPVSSPSEGTPPSPATTTPSRPDDSNPPSPHGGHDETSEDGSSSNNVGVLMSLPNLNSYAWYLGVILAGTFASA